MDWLEDLLRTISARAQFILNSDSSIETIEVSAEEHDPYSNQSKQVKIVISRNKTQEGTDATT